MKRVLLVVLALGILVYADVASAGRGSHSGSHARHSHRAVIVPFFPVFYGVPLAGYHPAPYYGSAYDTVPPTNAAPGEPRFYCPDSRQYYPAVPSCRSAWLKVVP